MLLYGIIAAVAAFAGGLASIAGFGIGSLLTPLLASQYGMKAAVGAVSIPHAIATALRFWMLRGEVDRDVFFRFGLLNAAGSLIGALIHARVDSPVLGVVLGVLLVFAGLGGLTGYSDRLRFTPRAAWAAGALSGSFGGLVGNQGGIRSAAMLALRQKSEASGGKALAGASFVATATAIGLAVDAVRMPVYFAIESEAILSIWPAIVAALIGVVLGTVAGAKLLRRIPERAFRKVVAAVLLGIGILLLGVRPG